MPAGVRELHVPAGVPELKIRAQNAFVSVQKTNFGRLLAKFGPGMGDQVGNQPKSIV